MDFKNYIIFMIAIIFICTIGQLTETYIERAYSETPKVVEKVVYKPLKKPNVKFSKLEADGLYQGKYVPVELYNAMVQEHASKEQYIKASLEVTLDNVKMLKNKIEELEESVRILRDASGYDCP